MEKLDALLYELGLHPDCIPLPAAAAAFQEEMSRGLAGAGGSLDMVPTWLSAAPPPRDSEEVLALDCGGTRFRRALVRFAGGEPVLSDYLEAPMPGAGGGAVLPAEAFWDALGEMLHPLARPGMPIGFCFSYPMSILPDHDGVLLRLTKELRLPELVGRRLAPGLLSRLPEGCGPAVLLNDTAASLLGGVAAIRDAGASGAAGMILGTGFNCCYAAKGAELIKCPGAPDMIVNLECGNYAQPQGALDRELDAGTDDPGKGVLEKMLSGAYHAHLAYLAAGHCARAGLFTASGARALERGPVFRAEELEDFVQGRGPWWEALTEPADRETLLGILRQSNARAARLVAMVLTALLRQTGAGTDPARPFCVVADGSAFYRSTLFRAALDRELGEALPALGRHIRFLKAPGGNLPGAAAAALQALDN